MDLTTPPTNPSDPLRSVFSRAALERLRAVRDPSPDLVHRLAVLSASGPVCDSDDATHIRSLIARRSAWDAYVTCAFGCALLPELDLQNRLTAKADSNFRAAMAECMAAWFFAGHLHLDVTPRPPGRNDRNLDLRVRLDAWTGVEVKAPFRHAAGDCWSGDDADLLQTCLKKANEQFPAGQPNLLFLAPVLRAPLYGARYQLLRAFYGEHRIVIPLNARTGEPAGADRVAFFPEGRFLQTRTTSGASLRADGRPRYTRVSAVVCVEERWADAALFDPKARPWIDHRILVLKNPYAEHPIKASVLDHFPQLEVIKGRLEWSDGRSLVP